MIYEGIVKKTKTGTKIAALIAAAFITYFEIQREQWIYLIVVAVIILAVFFDKRHLVTEEGVDLEYLLFGVPVHNVWTWDEIDTLHADWTKSTETVMLHIGKDVTVRSYNMRPEDMDDILALAKEKNPSIYIENLTREAAAKKARDREHAKLVEQARRRAKKRK